MTSHSDQLEDGETVWEAFAWMGQDQRPYYRIRRATFTRSATGYELLHYENGTVDTHWPTSGRRAYRSHADAVGHCVGVFVRLRHAIEDAIEEVESLLDDESGGPVRAGETAAGTAPPEVAR